LAVLEAVPAPHDEQQLLPVARPDRDHETAAVGQLRPKRGGHGGSGGGDHYPFERGVLRAAKAAVTDLDSDEVSEA
jgi:hypothetical protein